MPGSPPQAVPPLACRVSWAWSCSLLVSSGGSPRLWAGLAGGTVSPAASIPVAPLFLPSPCLSFPLSTVVVPILQCSGEYSPPSKAPRAAHLTHTARTDRLHEGDLSPSLPDPSRSARPPAQLQMLVLIAFLSVFTALRLCREGTDIAASLRGVCVCISFPFHYVSCRSTEMRHQLMQLNVLVSQRVSASCRLALLPFAPTWFSCPSPSTFMVMR